MKKFTNKISNYIYTFRYDLFSGLFIFSFILWTFEPFFSKGHIVFSDISFGYYSENYLTEIFGLWNERWSTTTLLNIPRLIYILPLWIVSMIFGGSGPVLIKGFILILVCISAGSMYLLSKRIISLYFGKEFDFYKVFALVTGALYYALNPWVIFRIQHIYLLCGYSLFPLLLRLLFDIFDPKFQKQVIKNYNVSRVLPYEKNIKDIAIFSFLYSISAGAIHYFFYGALYFFVIGSLILIKNILIILPDTRGVKDFIKNVTLKLTILISFFILTSFYWFGTYILSIVTGSQTSQHNINTVDTITLFSRNSSPLNVLYLNSYWWPMFDITKLPFSYYLGGGFLIFFIIFAMFFRSYKYHIIFFFTILSLMFIGLSTGTKIEVFAPYFVNFVTKTPVIGSMFRDPNKLVGLLAVGFSLLLTFGVEQILMKFKNSYKSSVMKGLFIILIIISLNYYITPFKNEFIDGFYSPVDIPIEMTEAQENFYDGGEFSKVLYLPTADNMIQASTGVATPYWNQNQNLGGSIKATGDIHIYTSKKNTIFHHEGNIMGITYYLAYIQDLMDKGISRNIGKMLKAFPIDEIAYHNEYLGQEKRQAFNLKMLEEQKTLKKHYSNKIYTLYKLKDHRDYMQAYGNKIYTPYGFSKMETYLHRGNLNLKEIPIIFMNQNLDEELFYEANKYDYIEAENFTDLLLSSIPEKHYSFPFDYVKSANVFLDWGKVLIKNNDWRWLLNSQGINSFPYDFDMGKGLAVTFSTSKLDIEPYQFKGLNKKIIADFDSLLRTNKFFTPDNPQLFSVQAIPKEATNKIPILRGEIVRGEPKSIWQVAKSGLIEAKEDNPYQFNILISGRGTNKLHVKVRFFDDKYNEVGVSYVIAPKEEFFFDEMDFYGEYITPPNTKYMRFDLLSFQNTNQKNYWWIHDLNIKDLEEYKKENMFTLNPKGEIGEKGSLYIRALVSKKGGRLELKNGDDSIEINTNNSMNKLKWIEIENFEIKDKNLKIFNRKGFNAVNAVVFLSEENKKNYTFSTHKIIEKGNIFMALEGEDAFHYEGNTQTKRRYPRLSGGKAIRSQSGILKKEIEILKDRDYKINMNIEANPKYSGTLTFIIKNNKEEIRKIISTKDFKQTSDGFDTVIISEPLDEEFPRKYKKLKETLPYYQNIKLDTLNVPKGNYTLEVLFDSKVPTMSNLRDIHKFDPKEVKEPDFFEDIFQENCSECESIDQSMMRNKIKGNVLHMEFDPTCSCDWYVYASKMMTVKPMKEYLISYQAKSETIRKRHAKVIFLNDEKEIIDVQYISEVEERFKERWNKYEQLFTAPDKARYMQLQIWSRGDKKEIGTFQMKNYQVLPYDELIAVDNIYIEEAGDLELFTPKNTSANISYEKIDTMKRDFSLNNPKNERLIVSYGESPNPLWKESLDGQRVTRVINGVGAAFISDKNGDGSIEVVLRKPYYLGILLLLISIVLFLGLIIRTYINNRRGKNEEAGDSNNWRKKN
jgi:hypothetical protein